MGVYAIKPVAKHLGVFLIIGSQIDNLHKNPHWPKNQVAAACHVLHYR